jgi:hypothetical protein
MLYNNEINKLHFIHLMKSQARGFYSYPKLYLITCFVTSTAKATEHANKTTEETSMYLGVLY